MKILVTGALGHIGSSIIRGLPLNFPGVEIVIVDNLMTQRYCSLFDLPGLGKYKFIEADVTNADLDSIFKGIDVVIHLAAITDAAGSFDKAEAVETNNLNATTKVADACLKNDVKLIVLSSTSVYGTQSDRVDEACTRDQLKPQSPYALTKLKEEDLISSMVLKRGLKAVICRFGTIYGVSPGMRFHTAVNKFCWQAVMGTPVTIWKTAYEQKRPYLSLGDALQAFTLIIDRDVYEGEIYNVLTQNLTVREVIETIRNFVPSLKLDFVENKIMNQLSYEVSCEKFSSIGFRAFGDLTSSIGSTINLLANFA